METVTSEQILTHLEFFINSCFKESRKLDWPDDYYLSRANGAISFFLLIYNEDDWRTHYERLTNKLMDERKYKNKLIGMAQCE